jgi:hypothetical protein
MNKIHDWRKKILKELLSKIFFLLTKKIFNNKLRKNIFILTFKIFKNVFKLSRTIIVFHKKSLKKLKITFV